MERITSRIDNFEEIVKDIANRENIKNYEIIVEAKSTSKSDGYMGEMIFFSLKSAREERFFVLKLAQLQEKLREMNLVQIMFKEEALIYSRLMPEIRRLENECETEIFRSVPRMYWCSAEDKKEALIFENLSKQGFELWDKTRPLNLDHALFMVTEFAKFHAASYGLKMKKPEIFEDITKNLSFVLQNFVVKTKMIEAYERIFKDSIGELMRNGRGDLAEKYQRIADDFKKIYLSFEMGEGECTILHADSWMGNFMFKYQDNPVKPEEMRFLDFQAVRTGPPLSDIAMVVYFNCDRQVLDNFDLVLTTYRSQLCESGNKLGIDLSHVIPDLKKRWRRDALFAMLMSPCYVKMQLATEDETPKLTDMGVDFSVFMNHAVGNPEVRRRWMDVMVHYGDQFL